MSVEKCLICESSYARNNSVIGFLAHGVRAPWISELADELNSTQLNSTQLNSTQLNSTQLNSTQLNSTQLNSTQLNSIVHCGLVAIVTFIGFHHA
jgi:hypothetical protein